MLTGAASPLATTVIGVRLAVLVVGLLWWWVFPAKAVTSTEDEDASSMFDPVLDKHYREQAQYPVITMMRKIRAKGGKQDE